MSTPLPSWTGREALPTHSTLLLEASAGTGKTWQIAQLVVRLVAEADLPIERLLVITFTNDAAAELRDRIRNRLALARDALVDGAPAAEDGLLAAWQERADRTTLRTRLHAAYSAFDLAPISTIHGFSQRMLSQLAFESGQESGLTLLADVEPIREEWLADELARLYAACDVTQVALAADMGWTRAGLEQLADAVEGAVMPVVLPEGIVALPVVEAVRKWQEAVTQFVGWLDGPQGKRAWQAVVDAMGAATKVFNGHKIGSRYVTDYWPQFNDWLHAGASRSARAGSGAKAWAAAFLRDKLQQAWVGTGDVADFAGTPLFDAVTALYEQQDRLWSAARLHAATQARGYLETELQRRGALTYDAMLSRLADRVTAEGHEGSLARAIGARYDAALVDEFQDTDAAQWAVLHAAFQQAQKPLLLIGDPKQAIYGFRGADVHVYMAAVASGGTRTQRATMRRNWRSDPGYVEAMNHFWREGSDAFALSPDSPLPPPFDYVTVTAARDAEVTRVRVRPGLDEGTRAPLELRWFDGAVLGGDGPGIIGSRETGEQVAARLCAEEARRLLETAELVQDGAGTRELRPGDIAVLVRKAAQGRLVRKELAHLGIAAVAAGRQSVFASPVVDWLLAWLDALAAAGRDGQARTLATTPLMGWTLRELDDAVQAADTVQVTPASGTAARDWTAWMGQISRWAESWSRVGFIRVWESALEETGAWLRVLGSGEGERYATDLRHLAELCHNEERRARLSPGGVGAWLRDRIRESEHASSDDQLVRLESDAAAVQIVTVHASKGLEYPVVLLPFGWAEGGRDQAGAPIRFHRGEEVCLQLSPTGTQDHRDAIQAKALEERQERRRLLYVAVTRARHHAVVWLGAAGRDGGEPDGSALASLALRALPGENPSPIAKLPGRNKNGADSYPAVVAEWHRRLFRLAETSQGRIAFRIQDTLPASTDRVRLTPEPVAPLAAAAWPSVRSFASPWQVTSYSALSAGRTLEDNAPPGDWEPGQAGTDGAQAAEVVPARRAAVAEDVVLDAPLEPAWPQRTQTVALADMPGGTDVGQWVHAILEHLDFAGPHAKTGEPLVELAGRLASRTGLRYGPDHAALLTALPQVLSTPLRSPSVSLPGGFSLAQLGLTDRLDELQFDLSLAGGASWQVGRPCVEPGALRQAMAQRLDDTTWDGRAWLKQVHDGTGFPAMAGVLTGSIDLVLRVDGRFYIADYKTNKITSQRNHHLCLRGHYARPWLAWDMARHGYHLQALIYSVALHRFLRERLPGYDYERDFGGHLYLYLRGMEGPDALQDSGEAYGVYGDRWPWPVVRDLDAAMRGA